MEKELKVKFNKVGYSSVLNRYKCELSVESYSMAKLLKKEFENVDRKKILYKQIWFFNKTRGTYS